MAKKLEDMTYAELAQELYKRPDSLDHLMAKAEMARRAAVQAERNGRIMLASVIVAGVSAFAAMLSAIFSAVRH
jgi:hypothetical protein